MDRALWISWYDLPDAGRDAYLTWAHGTYMPAMVKRPGVLYAAHFRSVVVPGEVPGGGRLSHTKDPKLGTGNAYIMIVGAEDAHAFGRPTPRKIHAALSKDDQKMLAARRGEFADYLGLRCVRRERRDHVLGAAEALPSHRCSQRGDSGVGGRDRDMADVDDRDVVRPGRREHP